MFRKTTIALVLAVGVYTQVSNAQTIELVPVGSTGPFTITGHEIDIPTGGASIEVELEIQVNNWDQGAGTLLGVAQCKIDGTATALCPTCGAGALGYDNGEGTPLVPKGFGAGQFELGAYIAANVCFFNERHGCNPLNGQAPCDNVIPGGPDGPCVENPRGVMTPDATAQITGITFPDENYEYLLVSQSGGTPDIGTNNYFGTLILEIPAGAAGTYTIGFEDNPLSTLLSDGDVADIPIQGLIPATIKLPGNPCSGVTCPPSGIDCMDNECQDIGGVGTCVLVNSPVGAPCTDDGDLCTNDRCNPVGVCFHPLVNCLGLGDECCADDGMCKPPAQCITSDCTMVLSTNPPNCEVDAGQPHPIGDNKTLQGWMSMDFDFDEACSPANTIADFSVRTVPGNSLPPAIASVVNTSATTTVNFAGVIPTNEWTCVTHTPLGVEKCIGFLPADVNASLGSNAQDITALINSLNGVVPRPIFATDVNRSGPPANPQDITGLINLLNGAGAFIPWNGEVISTQCPS